MYFFSIFRRERLIHLLALRPFKKPELYARINGGKYQCARRDINKKPKKKQ